MNYEELIEKLAAEVREKFSPDQEEEIWNHIVDFADADGDIEDINPGEELFIDVMEKAFPE